MLKNLDQEGYLSEQIYKITLSKDFEKLYKEGIGQSKSLSWLHVAEDKGGDREYDFMPTVLLVGTMDLDKASGADVGTLIKYFSYRNKTLKEISKNMKYKIQKVSHSDQGF